MPEIAEVETVRRTLKKQILNKNIQADVLKLGHVYEYIYTLQDMEENINEVEIEEIEKAIVLSRNNGYDISMDLVILIDRKIRSGELTNYVFIGELEKLLGRKFL